MANKLTWRDVAPPDFSGSMQGIRIAGDALTNAGKTAMDALDKFDTHRKSDAANAVYQASMSYATPEELKAAMADGSLYAKAGVNPALVTADANKAIDGRASTLLAQTVTGQNIAHDKVMNPLRQENQRYMNEGQALLNQNRAIDNQYDARTLDTRVAQADATLASSRASTASTEQSTAQRGVEFEQKQQDRATSNAALAAAEKAARSGVTYNDALAVLNADDTLDGKGKAEALKLLPNLVQQYNPADPNAAGASVAAAATPAGRKTAGGAPAPTGSAPQAIASAASSIPVPTQDFDWSRYAVGGATRRDSFSGMAPEFSGALSAMFNAAPPEIQKELRVSSGYRSPERQAQLYSEALKKYGSPEAARKWVAPPNRSNHNHGHAADLKYLSPAAREWAHANAARFGLAFPLSNENWHIELASRRGGGGGGGSAAAPAPSPAQTPVQPIDVVQQQYQEQNSRASSLIADIATSNNQRDAEGIQGQYATTQANTELSMGDAVQQLKKAGFKDVPEAKIRAKLQEILTESRKEGRVPVTVATAAAIMDNSSSPENTGWIWDDWEVTSNSKAQTEELQRIGRGTSHRNAKTNSGAEAIAQTVRAAAAAKERAYEELKAAHRTAQQRPEVQATLPSKQAAYNRAAQALEQLIQAHGAKSAYRPQFNDKRED